MIIETLVENTSKIDIAVEHGLSLYIKYKNHRILFDSGRGSLFYENAVKMGIDLSKVDIFVLSHGHYDHGGGIEKFLEINKTAKIYINQNAFENFYNQEKFIGLNQEIKNNPRITFTGDYFEIEKGMSLFTLNQVIDENFIEYNLLIDDKIDKFKHEQYLLINDCIISGCSHKGVLNIINNVEGIKYFIGGFHTMKKENEQLEEMAKKLSKTNIIFYTCHCTGVSQYKYLKSFNKNIHYLSCGMKIEIGE